jgi:hypothetical protein
MRRPKATAYVLTARDVLRKILEDVGYVEGSFEVIDSA